MTWCSIHRNYDDCYDPLKPEKCEECGKDFRIGHFCFKYEPPEPLKFCCFRCGAELVGYSPHGLCGQCAEIDNYFFRTQVLGR